MPVAPISFNQGKVLLPIEPLQSWLEDLIAHAKADYNHWPNPLTPDTELMSPEARVAARLDISMDVLRKYRRGKYAWVHEEAVDRMCCNEGSTHPGELYPTYWAIAEAGGPRELLAQAA